MPQFAKDITNTELNQLRAFLKWILTAFLDLPYHMETYISQSLSNIDYAALYWDHYPDTLLFVQGRITYIRASKSNWQRLDYMGG